MRNGKRARTAKVVCAAAAVLMMLAGQSVGQVPGGGPGGLPKGVPPSEIIPKKKKSEQPRKVTDPTEPGDIAPGEAWGPKVLMKGNEAHWLATTNLLLQAVERIDAQGMPVGPSLKFDTAVVVFPVLERTAASRFIPANFKSKLTVQGREEDVTPEYIKGYQSGARLAKWEARQKDATEVRLRIEIGMACAATRMDEKLAMQIPWPKDGKWPETAASTFKPMMFVDYVVTSAEKAESDKFFAEKVKEWTEGADLKTIPPVRLAKMIVGRCIESVRNQGEGLRYNRTQTFQGFDLRGAMATLKEGLGSPHDLATVTVAGLRAGGIPARLVIGLDNTQAGRARAKPDKPVLHTWVEFCLVDPGNGKEIWIPVDPVKLRGVSSRAPGLDRDWRYFGSHESLADLIPLAFQFHPPTTVVAHGSPCLWGWSTTPQTLTAVQTMNFQVTSRPRRAGDDPKDDGTK